MRTQLSSLPFTTLLILIAILLSLSACTRERTPWPAGTPGLPLPPTVTGTGVVPTRSATILPPPALGTPASPIDTTPQPTTMPTLPGFEELTPEPPAPTPTPAPFIYVVQPGDTLFSIAQRFNVDTETLIRANNLTDPNTLSAGQKLKIPGGKPGGATAGQGTIHIVKRGETLYGIAQQYDVPLNRLADANNITDPSALQVGQKLVIPVAGQAQPTVPASRSRVYVVQTGDTLVTIASRYGTTVDAIMQANGLTDPNHLIVGQQLIIP